MSTIVGTIEQGSLAGPALFAPAAINAPAVTGSLLGAKIVTPRVLRLGDEMLWLGAAISDTVGNPAPSLRLVAVEGYLFRLAVKAGARTVSVDVRQPQASAIRPRLRVRANPSIGLASDLEAVAGASTDWQTISVSFTATANGGVKVELVNTDVSWPAWFDNLRI